MKRTKSHIVSDLLIVAGSIAFAVYLEKAGYIAVILDLLGESSMIGSFFAGIFFVSVFTIAPAVVFLFETAKIYPALEVAFFASIGAVIGDILIFKFVKDNLALDVEWVIKHTGYKKFFALFNNRIFRFVTPLLGALIVASPFPDELGLAMMGLSKMKMSLFIPLAFFLDFVGILLLGLIARGSF
ncbi:MAG: hypothetical protein A3H57_00340 [Candidatus Taylorbacteria bacterium RIFCSPLOWO2_02_FULL_43_11]|uniref:Uncharacterized protein n=1 Tax=Candidatus Taylorbacteria bacterium RIFCSPHIGHO2_02_FULL_43_32b TaxID=1802306 RepID=A0A1G2MDV8_9BACT|nr:MAG: hypothetical protein A2743_04475 [Candidatus Taylorbacteria bacterium RIFCSPHIGHO2_01_FULL_43_47]OHA22095.1 MAG: hypothetical protein A3C72_03280 [Candidatus Taylorbacteria bacterium RIFCSPHIGHO2_02_FULL_43_32b]OHA28769.1 MAG: hypothetical protein A3B08_02810 [Candidatus Taylorbacteria bacterium RIFCSPLOWO2_01_FULL_43_44]OHA35986.1 MAG: hypothetical protein A3H57_00340 [Candidatus Taylorbacteria bacterium RIFCSPLOWO2_02_FULL_43_11]